MSNDVADWTGATHAQLVGAPPASTPLGDVTTPGLSADSDTSQVSMSGNTPNNWAAVLAVFSPAAGQQIAQVGAAGPVQVGTNTAVAPAFGQATVAGHLLVAWVATYTVATESGPAGWVKAKEQSSTAGTIMQLWYKLNCGAAEAPPAFANGGGFVPMVAQLAEFSGVALVGALGQTGGAFNASGGSSGTVAASAADATANSLAVAGFAYGIGALGGSASFVDAYNNQAQAVQVGNCQPSQSYACSFSYAIIPSAATAQPLGVAPWAYDVTATSTPVTGTVASLVLAATPGKTYAAGNIDASIISVAATATAPSVWLKDGTTIIWQQWAGLPATAEAEVHIEKSMLGYKGTLGNSMTLGFSAGLANIAQSVNLGAYLR